MYIIVYDAAGELYQSTAGNLLEVFSILKYILLHHMELKSVEQKRKEYISENGQL